MVLYKNFSHNLIFISIFVVLSSSIKYIIESELSDSNTINYSKYQDTIRKFNNANDANDINNIISCTNIFDMHKHGYCIDVPSYYYEQNPTAYNRIIYYFNIVPLINYNKIRQCQIDDMILYINKLDTRYMDVFSIVS